MFKLVIFPKIIHNTAQTRTAANILSIRNVLFMKWKIKNIALRNAKIN